jgi:hypothetical protein
MIQGFLESATPDLIQGWAFDDEAPTVRLVVQASLGAAQLGHVEASASRPDLQGKWGDNDGNHGFIIELAPTLSAQKVAEVTVRAARPDNDKWHELPRLVGNEAVIRDAVAAITEAITASLDEMVSRVREAARQATEKAEHASEATHGWGAIDGFWSDDPTRPPLAPEESFPVFVTGAARSGTSAITRALVNATRYRGFAEGHMLDVAFQLITAIEAHFDTKRRILPSEDAEFHFGRNRTERLHSAVRQLLRQLAAGYTTPFWLDKTPTLAMVRSVPSIAQIWPNARFILMKRRALENIMSRQRKFPTRAFEENCGQWSSIMAEWRIVRSSIPGKFIELDQRSLLQEPVSVAERVGALLRLTVAEIDAVGDKLRTLRPEVTDPKATVIANIAATGWSAEMIETFRAICGPEVEAYGYTYDERYWL